MCGSASPAGLVVVGDLIGEGAAQERGVVGETPNLAARLQALGRDRARSSSPRARDGRSAGCSSSRISGRKRSPVLPSRSLPGASWAKVAMLSRFEALRSETTPLVGRDEELELLLRRWQQAKAGEGRVVLISGEPGIGKSRLTAALSQAHRERAAHPAALFLLAASSG